MGPAGMTLVIAKNEFINSAASPLPSMSDYRIYRDYNSMYNTPPGFPIYVAMLNLIWLKEQGGDRTVGGFRASLYNALPFSSIEYLVNVMQEFESSKKAVHLQGTEIAGS